VFFRGAGVSFGNFLTFSKDWGAMSSSACPLELMPEVHQALAEEVALTSARVDRQDLERNNARELTGMERMLHRCLAG